MHLKITVKAFYKIHFIQVFKFLNAICSIYILSLSFFNDTKQFKNLNTALLSTATCKLKCTVINKVIFSFPPTQCPLTAFFMAKVTTHKATCKLYCFKAVYNAKTHFGKRGKKRLYSALYPQL